MLIVLAAAALQSPYGDIRTARDLVKRLPEVSATQITVASVRYWVAPNGRVIDCELQRFIGDKAIADKMCEKANGVRLKPARDAAGEKVHAFYTSVVSAFPDASYRSYVDKLAESLTSEPLPAEFGIAVSSLPDELVKNPRIGVRILVKEAGEVAICEPLLEDDEKWAGAACGQVTQHRFEPMVSKNGNMVAYIRSVSVEFKLDEVER